VKFTAGKDGLLKPKVRKTKLEVGSLHVDTKIYEKETYCNTTQNEMIIMDMMLVLIQKSWNNILTNKKKKRTNATTTIRTPRILL
jgi:hypothetical protein